jgi:hypothetical protein
LNKYFFITAVKIRKVKKEIESLSSALSATDAQQFFMILFLKRR